MAPNSTATELPELNQADVQVSVAARSDVNAGVLLRYHNPDNYVVALYSSMLKALWIYDRENGDYGPKLGFMEVPEIGPDIHLIVEAHGSSASLTVTDGQHIYRTSPVSVMNTLAGNIGVWNEPTPCNGQMFYRCPAALNLPEEEKSQIFREFSVQKIEGLAPDANSNLVISDSWRAPNLPLSHDWVLVLER